MSNPAYCKHRTPNAEFRGAAEGWCKHPNRVDDREFPPCAHAKAVINGLHQFIGWGCERSNTLSYPLPPGDQCSHPNGTVNAEGAHCKYRTPTAQNPDYAKGYCEHPCRVRDKDEPPCEHARPVINAGQFQGWVCGRDNTRSFPLPVRDNCTHPDGLKKDRN